MYGGGFSTIPAYLADIFGTQFVGAIHGRLLTAWSTAGIIGPVVVNYIREFQLAAGIPRAQVYDFTMYIMAAMLAAGVVANFFVKPLEDKWFMSDEDVAAMQAKTAASETSRTGSFGIGKGGLDAKAALAWAAVGVPILWACGSRSKRRRRCFSYLGSSRGCSLRRGWNARRRRRQRPTAPLPTITIRSTSFPDVGKYRDPTQIASLRRVRTYAAT